MTFAKRYDAPTFYTKFKFLFGHVEYVVQGAPGQGIISSMVLLSDDLDEIDWEMTGTGGNHVQTNYYGKGFLDYTKAEYVNVASPNSEFHTYSLDWTAETLTWSIDHVVVRTLKASDAGNYFPQTPMKVSLSLWDGGDPSEPAGTMNWAGGETTLPPPESSTMYVKSVKITNAMPAQQYQYSDDSGTWQSIKVINEPFDASTSSITSSQSVVASIPLGFPGTASIPTAQTTLTSALSTSTSSTSTPAIESSSRTSALVPSTSTMTYMPTSSVLLSTSANTAPDISTGSATKYSVSSIVMPSLSTAASSVLTSALSTTMTGSTHEILTTQM